MATISIESGRTSLDFEKLTIDDTSGGVGFTATKILGTGSTFSPIRSCQEVFCTLDASTGPIRFTIDGTIPTTANGHLLNANDTLSIKNPHDIQNFRAIKTTATNGILQVTYKY